MSVDSTYMYHKLKSYWSGGESGRHQAEAHLNEWKQTDPNSLVNELVSLLGREEVREEASDAIRIVFRDLINHQPDAVWTQLTPSTQYDLKRELLHVLKSEKFHFVQQSIFCTVSELGAELISTGDWAELPGKLLAFTEDSRPTCQAAGFTVLTMLLPQLSAIPCSDMPNVGRTAVACASSDDGSADSDDEDDEAPPLWPTFASRLVESISDRDRRVRLAASFGLHQAAKYPQFPAELIQKAATKLFALLSETPSQEIYEDVNDNMIAALGAIVLHRKSCLQPSPEQFLNLWISNLPLKVYEEKGRRCHGDFVDLLVQRSPEVLGPANVNLPKLASICASIYQTDFSTEKIDEGIREFMQATGINLIARVCFNLDEKLANGLKRIGMDVWPSPLN